MRFKWLVGCIVFGLGLGFVGCKPSEQQQAQQAASNAEKEKLQGKWKIVSRQADEEDDQEDQAFEPAMYYVIDGDMMRLVIKGADGKEEAFSHRKLSVAGDKEPKQIDMTYVDEKGNPVTVQSTKKGITGRKKKTRTALKDVGIYKLEGDKLTICMSYDEKKRPTDYSSGRGSSRYVLTLEKIKDGAEDKKPKEEVKKPKQEGDKDKDKEESKKAKQEDKKAKDKEDDKKAAEELKLPREVEGKKSKDEK